MLTDGSLSRGSALGEIDRGEEKSTQCPIPCRSGASLWHTFYRYVDVNKPERIKEEGPRFHGAPFI